MRFNTQTPPNQRAYSEWRHLPVAERYFRFLGTTFTTDDGRSKQVAKDAFIELLREAHGRHQPAFDLSARLNGKDKNFRGRVWFWSDLHISHANIIKHCCRPFSDERVMNDVLIKSCMSTVSQQDVLVIGGDITMNDLETANVFLRAIPAHTILVLGNHDANKNQMLDLEVDEVAACLELNYKGQEIFVSHYPIDERLLDPGQVNLHGHIHNTQWPTRIGSGRRHFNMSVETIVYQPRQLHELLA